MVTEEAHRHSGKGACCLPRPVSATPRAWTHALRRVRLHRLFSDQAKCPGALRGPLRPGDTGIIGQVDPSKSTRFGVRKDGTAEGSELFWYSGLALAKARVPLGRRRLALLPSDVPVIAQGERGA